MKCLPSRTRPSPYKAITTSILLLLLLGSLVLSIPTTPSLDNTRHDTRQQQQQQQQQQRQQQRRQDQYDAFMKRQDSVGSPSPTPTTYAPSPISPSSFPSPNSPPTSLPSPSASQPQQPLGLLLPQNQPNVSQRVYPYTPATGTNYSLSITPNVTLRTGLVEIKIGVLLPYSLPNNLTQDLTFRYPDLRFFPFSLSLSRCLCSRNNQSFFSKLVMAFFSQQRDFSHPACSERDQRQSTDPRSLCDPGPEGFIQWTGSRELRRGPGHLLHRLSVADKWRRVGRHR